MDFGDSVENPIKQHPKPWESRRRGSKLPPYFDLSPENEERAKRNIRFHLPRYLADLLEIPMDPCEMEERPMFVKQPPHLMMNYEAYLQPRPSFSAYSIFTKQPEVLQAVLGAIGVPNVPASSSISMVVGQQPSQQFSSFSTLSSGFGYNEPVNSTTAIGSYSLPYYCPVAQNGGFNFSDEEGQPKVLYVGNLDFSVTEEFIAMVFGQIGCIIKVRIIFDATSDPYAFVEFADHQSATQALQTMNKRVLLNREMKVNWAAPGLRPSKMDSNRNFHVFIGDLSPEVDSKMLKDGFVQFGEVSDAKVIRDPQTLKSKGYGFVSYARREDAEKAIKLMNGQWLGRRTIRTNWATRKPTETWSRNNF